MHSGFQPVAEAYPAAAEAMTELIDRYDEMRTVKDSSNETGDRSIFEAGVHIQTVLATYYGPQDDGSVEQRLALFGNDSQASRLRFTNHYSTLRNKLIYNDKLGEVMSEEFGDIAQKVYEDSEDKTHRLIGAFIVYDPASAHVDPYPSPKAYSTLVMSPGFTEGVRFLMRDALLEMDEGEAQEDLVELTREIVDPPDDIKDEFFEHIEESVNDHIGRLRRLESSTEIEVPRYIMASMPNEDELRVLLEDIPLGRVVAPS